MCGYKTEGFGDIGDLNQNIALSELQNRTSSIKNTTIPKFQDDEDEDD